MAKGQFDDAFECFRNSVIKRSNDSQFWNAIAIYYFVKENYKEAFEKIIMATTLKPQVYEFWFNLGILYEKCRQPEEAHIAYTKALEIEPTNKDVNDRINFISMKNPNNVQENSNHLYSLLKHLPFQVSNSLQIQRDYKNLKSNEKYDSMQSLFDAIQVRSKQNDEFNLGEEQERQDDKEQNFDKNEMHVRTMPLTAMSLQYLQ